MQVTAATLRWCNFRVAADLDAPLRFERVEDLFTIRIRMESRRFPEAFVSGG